MGRVCFLWLLATAFCLFESNTLAEDASFVEHAWNVPQLGSPNIVEFVVENKSAARLPAAEIAPINCLADVSCVPCSDWSFFAGLTGSKQPQDFGVNAHFGARTAANYGRQIGNTGFGLQLGTALVSTDNAVQVIERVEGSSSRFQSFSTVGLFQHADHWHWGAGYDFMYQRYYDDFFLGQWRAQIGYDITCLDQMGLRVQLRGVEDTGEFASIDVTLRSINQVTGYWNHAWPGGAMIGCWLGAADAHGEVNVALGDLPRRDTVLVFGSNIRAPLSDHLSLVGEANFITPADTGTVDAYLGLEFVPGGGARIGRKYRPILPVASNATFSVDLLR